VVCAVTARKYYPDKSITVIKDIANGVIPCGIPYMFVSLSNPEENKLGMGFLVTSASTMCPIVLAAQDVYGKI
jgi:hypothetical protein